MHIRRSSKSDIGLSNLVGLGTNHALVACNDLDKPAGYIAGGATSEPSKTTKYISISSLFVSRYENPTDAQVRQIAGALLSEFVKANGGSRIRISSKIVNPDLKPVLASLGFEIQATGFQRPPTPTAHHPLSILAADEPKQGIVLDIEEQTTKNQDFRRVIYTGKHLQLVLMSLDAGEEIGVETHEDVDQFFRIDGGSGECIIGGKTHKIKNGSAFVIPAGTEHNVIAGDGGLKLYSLYSPPNHKDGTVHHTKADVKEESFDGQTTES